MWLVQLAVAARRALQGLHQNATPRPPALPGGATRPY